GAVTDQRQRKQADRPRYLAGDEFHSHLGAAPVNRRIRHGDETPGQHHGHQQRGTQFHQVDGPFRQGADEQIGQRLFFDFVLNHAGSVQQRREWNQRVRDQRKDQAKFESAQPYAGVDRTGEDGHRAGEQKQAAENQEPAAARVLANG